EVFAIATKETVVAAAAKQDVVARPAIEGEHRVFGRQRHGREGIVAGATGDDERIGCLRGADGDELRQTGDRQRAALAQHVDVVVALGAVDGHAVGREVAGAAAGRRCQVNGDLHHAGAGKIVDRDGVGAAQGVELDVLDAIDVHGDVADVAGEPHAA